MAGQPTPSQLLTEAFAADAPTCTQAAPVGGGRTSPVPTTASAVQGGASFDTGFPALNFIDPTDGGIPPFGIDFNGIFYLLSAWLACLTAGQLPVFSMDLATAIGGYKLGAMLSKADGSGFWVNLVDGNTTDPDTDDGDSWIDWLAGGADGMSANLGAGQTNNWSPTGFGPSVGFIRVNLTAGAASLSGLIAGLNGQTVTLSNISGSGNLTLLALSGSSSAANQFFAPSSGVTLIPGQSITVRYSTGVNQWIVT